MSTDDRREEWSSICNSSATNQPGRAGAFANLAHICIMQIRTEPKCKFVLHPYTSPPQKQIRWLQVRCGGQTGDYVFTLQCDSKDFFRQWAKPHPNSILVPAYYMQSYFGVCWTHVSWCLSLINALQSVNSQNEMRLLWADCQHAGTSYPCHK